jgi:hypothetical protein
MAVPAGSGGLAFVERNRHRMRMMLNAAAARTHAALRHDVAHGLFALAAAHGDAELELELVKRIDAFSDRSTDLPVGYRLAHADNHGMAQ